jgi:iron-sulfur cluster assembly protein
VLELTEGAQRAIRKMLEEAELGEDGGLRIGSVGVPGGDVELEFDLVAGSDADDEVVEAGGARVYLDEVAAEALADMSLAVEEHGDHVHFELNERDASA